MKRMTPLGALLRGFAAGLAGAVAQDLFYAVTKKRAPAPQRDAFTPPEPAQALEQPTQTVARRFVEGVALRGPFNPEALSGQVVHHAVGTAWGGVYGIAAGSAASMCTLRGGLWFGVAVWLLSDNLLLPAVRLNAWPQEYPVNSHAYAMGAHLIYGAAVYAAFKALDKASPSLSAALGAALLVRRIPKPVRPAARRLAMQGIRFTQPARDVIQVLH